MNISNQLSYRSQFDVAKNPIFSNSSLSVKEKTTSLLNPSWKYIASASAAAIIAGTFFCFSSPLIIVGLAGWLFCTLGITLANHFLKDSETLSAKNIRQIHAAVADINCSFANLFLFPATLFSKYHEAEGNLKGRPILAINGYLGFASTWTYLRHRLSLEGDGPVYTMNVGSFASIAEYAGDVRRKVRKIKEETGRNDIALLCHSKGGLVGSYYATKLAASDGIKVTDIVMIGSPLAGTPIAKYGLGQDAKEMHPDHPFHADLRKEIARHPEIRIFRIASEVDTVVPLSSALIGANPSRQMVFKDLGHLGMLFSPRTADQILQWLRG